MALYWDNFTFLYVDDARTSEETYAFTDSFISFNVDDARTSQEA
jgi:hypothetical protein